MLTRIEELILLVIWKAPEEAYGYGIRSEISNLTGSSVSIGAIHTPLRRLAKRGLLTSWDADPTPERGGRAKRFYQLTADGAEALKNVQQVTHSAWKGVSLDSLPRAVQFS